LPYFPHFRTSVKNHDRRAHLSDSSCWNAAGPISVFEIAMRFAGGPPSIKVAGATPGPVRSSSGVRIARRGLKPIGAISTLIVAGGEGVVAARQSATRR